MFIANNNIQIIKAPWSEGLLGGATYKNLNDNSRDAEISSAFLRITRSAL